MSAQPSAPPPPGSPASPATASSAALTARRFLREGLAVWVGVAVVFGLAGLAVPQVYSSVALLEIALPSTTAGAAVATPPEAIERQLNDIIDDPRRVAALAREEGAEPSKDDLVRARGAVRVRSRSPRTFELSYQAGTPALSQSGCTLIASAIVSHFEELAHPAGGAKTEDPRAALEQRTKELTDFVVAHPEALVGGTTRGPGDSPATDAARAASDPAIAVLRQEKARVEARLAQAEASAKSSHSDNPYDEGPAPADVPALREKLVQLKNAITAHERALSSSGQQGGAPKTALAAAQEDEWRRLVKAVTDAQRAVFTASTEARPVLVARLLEPPSLPSRPAESWRGPIAFAGVVLGLVTGVLWALFRVFTSKRLLRASSVPPAQKTVPIAESQPGSPEDLAAPERESFPSFHGEEAPDAPPRPPNPAAVAAAVRAARDAPVVRPDGNVDIPRAPGVPSFGPGQTQIGMIDPAVFGARTVAHAGGQAPRAETRPTADATPDRKPVAPAPRDAARAEDSSFGAPRSPMSSRPPVGSFASPRTGLDSTSSQWVSAPQPRGSHSGVPMPRGVGRHPVTEEAAPITERVGTSDPAERPGRSSSPAKNDALAAFGRDTTYSYVDPDSRAGARRRASERPGSDPPRRTSSNPPAERPGSDPVPDARAIADRSERAAPPLAASRAYATQPGWARPTPPGLVVQGQLRPSVSSRPPEPKDDDIVNPRSAPPSWRIRPSFSTGPVHEELNALRDQIMAQALERCFVVGVSSERALVTAKSQIAARLAAMLAADGRARVLLLEADFDFPAVHELMAIEMPHSSGFSQQMRARIKSNRRKPWVVVRCSPTLHVLAEGIVRSPGILFSQEFSEAVAELRRGYDVIVIDGPTAGVGEDHKPIDAIVDGLVFVSPAGAELTQALDRAARWFARKDFMAAVSAGPVQPS